MKIGKLILVLSALFFSSSLLVFAEPHAVKIIDLNNKKEYVLIKNEGKTTIDLNGWQLHDQASDKSKKHLYTFKALQLKPGEILQIQSGISKKTQAENPQAAKLKDANHYIFWTNSKIWNDAFDIAYLRDDKGNPVDQKQNGKSGVKKSSDK